MIMAITFSSPLRCQLSPSFSPGRATLSLDFNIKWRFSSYADLSVLLQQVRPLVPCGLNMSLSSSPTRLLQGKHSCSDGRHACSRLAAADVSPFSALSSFFRGIVAPCSIGWASTSSCNCRPPFDRNLSTIEFVAKFSHLAEHIRRKFF